ncbi:unnamed protein product [Lactuca saligna]|uniref:Uncharacterized protein n=1 Tax=Lactuca saligna TaxID=75948 RepID=A0AA36A1C6_LACSI|nr:unnamed protein product [Lactuca saligna]
MVDLVMKRLMKHMLKKNTKNLMAMRRNRMLMRIHHNEDEENFYVNKVKVLESVGLVDGVEGDFNDIQEGSENLVECGVNQKVAKDYMKDILMGIIYLFEDDRNKEEISYDTVNNVTREMKKEDELIVLSLVKCCVECEVENYKVKKDGESVVESKARFGDTDFGNRLEEIAFGIPILCPNSLEYWYDQDVH